MRAHGADGTAGQRRGAVLFVALAAALVVAGILAALVRQDYFTQTTRLYFFADSAQGIAGGMSVQLSGFRIGSVDALSLEPNAKVKVRMVINSEYMRFLAQDSSARLAKEALIGASFIEITPGSKDARPLANDAVLEYARAADFADIAKGIADDVKPILADLRDITARIGDPRGDVQQTLANVRTATAALAEASQNVNRLTASGDARLQALQGSVDAVLGKVGTTLDQAGRVLEGVQGVVGTVQGTVAKVDAQVPQLILRLDATLKNAETLSADAKRLGRDLADDVPPAVREGRDLVQDTHRIVDGVRGSWPVRNMVTPPAERAVPFDSHGDAAAR